MKLGFIGVGNVGSTLAKKLGKKGHSIFLGVRNPSDSKAEELSRQIGTHASVHTVAGAVEVADVVFLATPWDVTKELVESLNLKGKVIVDCTNPFKPDLSGLSVGLTESGGELVQSWAPLAKVVKAFNTTGFNIMADPIVDGRKAAMYFCGDDGDAKFQVEQLIRDVGLDPIDGGPLATARLLEPYALLWVSTAYKFGFGRDFAFSVLRRK
jgi:8-hydroxy-5-deazaflavin:NADPH oxidoreductase